MTLPTTIEEVVDQLELETMWVFEQRTQRRDVGLEDVAPADVPEADTQVKLNVLSGQADNNLMVRIQATVIHPALIVNVDVSGVWQKAELGMYDDALAAEFVSRVGVMTIYPEVRSLVFDLSSRAGIPVTVGMLRAGALEPADV